MSFEIPDFMKNLCFAILSVMILFGCANQKTSIGTQGLIGEVRWVEGNLMPTIGDTTYVERAKGIPIEREIYIFKAIKIDEAISAGGSFYKSVNAELVLRLKSNKNGIFKANLPVGKYSIFILEKDGYFANTFDGDNYISPVTIHANKTTEIQILVNYQAYY